MTRRGNSRHPGLRVAQLSDGGVCVQPLRCHLRMRGSAGPTGRLYAVCEWPLTIQA